MQRVAKALRILGFAGFATLGSQSAIATDPGWYVGGNVGQSVAEIDKQGITSGLLDSGLTTISLNSDAHDLGFKVFGGYQFNRYLAVEGGYFNLGKFGFTATTSPPGTLDGTVKLQGANFDVVGTVPVTDTFSAFGRVGVNHAESDGSFTGTGAVTVLDSNPGDWDTSYKFGFGLQYDFTEYFSIRAEAERYRINDNIGNDGDVDLFSAGMMYRFGGSAQGTATPRAETPAAP